MEGWEEDDGGEINSKKKKKILRRVQFIDSKYIFIYIYIFFFNSFSMVFKKFQWWRPLIIWFKVGLH